MIIIDLHIAFKIISLICSGILVLAYFVGSLKNKTISFLNMLITSILLILPFTYILLN